MNTEEEWRLYPILEGDRVIVPAPKLKSLWSRGREGTVVGIRGYEESIANPWSKVIPEVLVRLSDGSSKWYPMKEVIRTTLGDI